jgi:hypothetical protein
LAEAIVSKPPGRNSIEIMCVALEEGGLQLIQPTDHEFGLSQDNILAGDKGNKGKK